MKHKIRCYYWNPNGTNDIEIVNLDGDVVDSIPEALFGVSINSNTKFISLTQALRAIAVSPVSDGIDTVRTLTKYFKQGGT